MNAAFKPYDLELVTPDFESTITDFIIELEHLRKKELKGSTHPQVFFQLKHLFHTLESIGSARIEGNNTTIVEYFDTKLDNSAIKDVPFRIQEIRNIEKAMVFVEDNIRDFPINKAFVSELHKIIVDGLPVSKGGEGDSNPGMYRKHGVKILNSKHQPPDAFMVDGYMDELFAFVNSSDASKFDLLKVAIAHHRFVWIHPFGNGNGRTVRLFTYAMLIRSGFNVNVGRILNPTAIFCSNRYEYYEKLSKADMGTKEGILDWCEYVLSGLKAEIEKIDRLSDYEYLKNEILLPSIELSLKNRIITSIESKILKEAIEKQVIQNSDLEKHFRNKAKSEISRQIKKLIEKKMLVTEQDALRKYVLRFDNNYLLRAVIKTLDDKGFLPIRDN